MNKKKYAVIGYNDMCIATAKTLDKAITKMIELGGKDIINLSTRQYYNKTMNKIFKEVKSNEHTKIFNSLFSL